MYKSVLVWFVEMVVVTSCNWSCAWFADGAKCICAAVIFPAHPRGT